MPIEQEVGVRTAMARVSALTLGVAIFAALGFGAVARPIQEPAVIEIPAGKKRVRFLSGGSEDDRPWIRCSRAKDRRRQFAAAHLESMLSL